MSAPERIEAHPDDGHQPGSRGVAFVSEAYLAAALAERDAALAEARNALIYIAHTFTEDSHGNVKSLPAMDYRNRARAALARIDALQPAAGIGDARTTADRIAEDMRSGIFPRKGTEE